MGSKHIKTFPAAAPHNLMVSILSRHRTSLINKEVFTRLQDIMPQITTRDNTVRFFKTVSGTGPTPRTSPVEVASNTHLRVTKTDVGTEAEGKEGRAIPFIPPPPSTEDYESEIFITL
jgi:hypothetical protein